MPNVRAAVEAALCHTCLCLDEERFDDWLAVCTDDFRYSIQTYSPEIRRRMTWMSVDRAGMEKLTGSLRNHQRDPGALFRHPSLSQVAQGDDGDIETTSSVLIIRTGPDGISNLFAAVRYLDRWSGGPEAPRLRRRRVEMATRILLSDAGGSHVPL